MSLFADGRNLNLPISVVQGLVRDGIIESTTSFEPDEKEVAASNRVRKNAAPSIDADVRTASTIWSIALWLFVSTGPTSALARRILHAPAYCR